MGACGAMIDKGKKSLKSLLNNEQKYNKYSDTAFDKVDKDKNGYIEKEELTLLIHLYHLHSHHILNYYYWFMNFGDGDWGLGIGDWAQSPIPNPQSPIPNPQSIIYFIKNKK